MIEQLVSYELAKLAEEKGFGIQTDRVYLDSITIRLQDGLMNYPKALYKGRIYAPTQGFLQRWLREKHYLHINIRTNAFMDKEDIDYTWDIFGFHDGRFRLVLQSGESLKIDSIETKEKYNTYEEALEIALQQTLKIINLLQQ